MATTYYYTLVIQETAPSNPQLGWIWIKESVRQAWMWIGGGWSPFAGG